MSIRSDSERLQPRDGVLHTISPREIIFKYLPYLPWVLASIIISLTIAFIKLRYSPNIYSVSGTILVQESNPYGSKAEKFNEIFLTGPDRNLNDEVQVIKSRTMAKRVVRKMGLGVMYYNQGKIRSTLVYTGDSPLRLEVSKLKDSVHPFSIQVNVINDFEFTLAPNGPTLKFGQVFEIEKGQFIIHRTNHDLSSFASNMFYVSYAPIDNRADQLISTLYADQNGESSNIIRISFTTENPRAGVDIVNQWMTEYQLAGLEEKRQIAVNALEFIDQQMDTVRVELGGVERNLQNYRESNKVYNPEQQSENFFKSLSELEAEITRQGVKAENVNFLIRYLSDNSNPHRQVISLLGIEEPTLAVQIQEFNSLQVQRETLLKTTTAANPMVQNADASIEKLRIDILQNLRNIKSAYELSINSLKSKNVEKGKEVSLIPSKEKQLLDITRRQKILEELYSFLLQKKLETSISAASTISNVKVIESAIASESPVMPNRKGTYLAAFIVGLLIPIAVIFLKDYLNDKVNSRDEIEKVTQAPIIGEVGHSEGQDAIVVTKISRKFIAEQFRILRTNLQYVLPKQDKFVMLVTSSSSGEGKSFVSTNVGAVLALAGKRTVILEFDIRKPKVMSALKLVSSNGLTNYIIGKAKIADLPIPVPSTENLFVIPCGPIPPNPAEMLLNPKLSELFETIREMFDVVIIDTAPVGLVSDAIMLGKYADATLYVVRHNYTYKKQLQLFNEIYTNDKLPRVSIVINDIDVSGGYGKYYGYGGSGYTGYSYGYGTQYFDDVKEPKNLFQKIREIFRRS